MSIINKIKRQQYILKKLNDTGSVLVSEISLELNCSTETIRRDLKEMEKEHELIKIHGGAYFPENNDKGVPVSLREKIFKKEKEQMAQISIKFIKEGDLIFLDHSTTCLAIAKEIYDKNLKITIVTNSLNIIKLFDHINCKTKIICLGGNLKLSTGAFIGQQTIDNLNYYISESCFISCPSISMEFGLADNSLDSANIRKQMLNRTRKKILVLDHTKFQSNSDIVITTLENIDILITDKELDIFWLEYLNGLNIKILY